VEDDLLTKGACVDIQDVSEEAPVVAPPQSSATQPRAVKHGRRGALVAAIGIPTALTGLHATLYGRWIVDDAAISFAYARSIAKGLGPVLQPGDPPVEGYSNPAWEALLVLGRWLGIFDQGSWFGIPDYVAFPKLLAILCCAILFGAYYAIASTLTAWPVRVTVVAGAIAATIPSFTIWAFSGLENALYAATVGWIAAVLVRATTRGNLLLAKTAIASGLLAALAALIRPDGLIYVLAYPLVVVALMKGPRLRACTVNLLAFSLPMGAYVLWRFVTFGQLLPNTALAKAQGLPGLLSIARPFELIVYSGCAPALLGLALVVYALRTRSDKKTGLLALLLTFGLAILDYALLRGDWMGQRRFATPIWALAAILICVAGALVFAADTQRNRRVLVRAAAVTAIVMIAVSGYEAMLFRRNPTVPVCAVASYAGWTVNAYASALNLRNAVIVTPDIGGSAMVSDLKVVDLAGLADAELAKLWRRGDMSGVRTHIFAARPEFIEIHDAWSRKTGLTDDPRLTSDYSPITRTSPTDGLWVRRDLAMALAALGTRPVSARSRPLLPSKPYQLVNPLESCGQLTARG
jgi:hypothetical protein